MLTYNVWFGGKCERLSEVNITDICYKYNTTKFEWEFTNITVKCPEIPIFAWMATTNRMTNDPEMWEPVLYIISVILINLIL